MAKTSIYAIIQGRVQGVFFRDYTRKEAIDLGLTGWVQNRPDGSVEALFSGEKEAVNRMIDWLHIGPPIATVDSVQTEERDTQESFTAFEVRY